MVKNIYNIVLVSILILSSCSKSPMGELMPQPIVSEYLDTESDTLLFLVYDKNPFIAIDNEKWVKVLDTCLYRNSRTIKYLIKSNKAKFDHRNFLIEPSKLRTSSDSFGSYLSIYKTYLLNEDTQKFYFERDESGKATRFFSSKLIDLKTDYYSGKCIWTYLEYTQTINDSTGSRTIIDEYYAPKIGLVKIRHEKKTYINGHQVSDSIINKFRVL